MRPEKPGNCQRPGPEVVERENHQRASDAKSRNWTVQNEMRGVLGRVSESAARRILDSTNSREIGALQKTVSVAAKTRENTASVTREHKFLGGNQGNLCVEEF